MNRSRKNKMALAEHAEKSSHNIDFGKTEVTGKRNKKKNFHRILRNIKIVIPVSI